jgi:uncharacterized delta-60 repeat protein
MTRECLARINPDGSLDTDFQSGADRDIEVSLVQADGKLLVGGQFTSVAGTPRSRLARLNADGSLDATFDPDVNDSVFGLVQQADGKIVIGGYFDSVGGVIRNHVARLDPDGSPDDSFDPDADDDVYRMAQQADGKILVAGEFTSIGGVPRNHIARLDSDGSVDESFDAHAEGYFGALALQPDGKILVGGDAITIDGATRNGIARLNADGSLDADFSADIGADVNFYYVRTLTLQADGKVLVAGNFNRVGGVTRNHIARLSQADAALQSLTVVGDTVTWRRAGSSPELVMAPQLLFSSDGETWDVVGNMQRTAGGWIYEGLELPASGQAFHVRALGRVPSVSGSGLVQSTRQAYRAEIAPNPDGVFCSGFESAESGICMN